MQGWHENINGIHHDSIMIFSSENISNPGSRPNNGSIHLLLCNIHLLCLVYCISVHLNAPSSFPQAAKRISSLISFKYRQYTPLPIIIFVCLFVFWPTSTKPVGTKTL